MNPSFKKAANNSAPPGCAPKRRKKPGARSAKGHSVYVAISETAKDLISKGCREEALGLLEEGLMGSHDNPVILFQAAKLHLKLKTPGAEQRAERYLKQALLLNPQNTYCLQLVGDLFANKGQPKLARAAYVRAYKIETTQKRPNPHVLLGKIADILTQMKEFDQAEALCLARIEENPDDHAAQRVLKHIQKQRTGSAAPSDSPVCSPAYPQF